MVRTMINKHMLRQTLKEKGCRIGDDYFDRLNECVDDLINDSVKRGEANIRKTVYARDL